MDELRQTWRRLDDAGLDWISAWDHLYEAPPEGGTVDHYETVSTLAALCADTRNARVGVLVMYVGYRNPALIAKTAATLDHLSGGRFELGLGAGWHVQEANAFGYDFPALARRFEMLAEAVQIIKPMLQTTERVTFTGEHFRVDEVANLPHPMQPHLPIWIGGVGEKKTLPLIAAYADGWNAAYIGPEEFARLGAVLDQRCADIGRDPAEIKRSINLQFLVGVDQAEADRLFAETLERWGPRADAVINGSLRGTPDQMLEQIAAYRDAGADGLNIALRAPWNAEALDAYVELAPGKF